MPIYEYKCTKCGEEFEAFVLSILAKADEVECPRCRSREVKRKISLFGFAGSKGSTGITGSSCSSFSVG
ncbi:MAG: zinc ribbon domain-containing protein [Anaerolineae bacterium]|nr:zinc ribbon domain-containing protein [Anaerolineae bacterium]MDW8102356.1 zinc ribbon domain-containing protein [Anaerolineae bacterium]